MALRTVELNWISYLILALNFHLITRGEVKINGRCKIFNRKKKNAFLYRARDEIHSIFQRTKKRNNNFHAYAAVLHVTRDTQIKSNALFADLIDE